MDTSIIGIALRKMQAELGFSRENPTWVFIAFGGPLLGGGCRTCSAHEGCSPRAG